MKSPHLSALIWIILLSFLAMLVFVISAAMIDIGSYSTSSEVIRKAALNGLADLSLLVAIVSTLAAIALAGVRHLLTQLPDMAAKLETDAEAARAASAAHLAEYRAAQAARQAAKD